MRRRIGDGNELYGKEGGRQGKLRRKEYPAIGKQRGYQGHQPEGRKQFLARSKGGKVYEGGGDLLKRARKNPKPGEKVRKERSSMAGPASRGG